MKRTPEEERIFRALAQIKTPEADLSAALRRAEEPRRIRPVRPLAAAAVLCALLTIGAAAVGFSGAWRYFVHSLPQNAVQTVGASQTSGDYTLTVDLPAMGSRMFRLTPEAPRPEAAQASARRAAAARRKAARTQNARADAAAYNSKK